MDPVFSSGLLIAFQSAELLAKALIDGSERALAFYEKETLRNLEAWQRVIGWFYDGRLLTLLKVGQYVRTHAARAGSSTSISASTCRASSPERTPPTATASASSSSW